MFLFFVLYSDKGVEYATADKKKVIRLDASITSIEFLDSVEEIVAGSFEDSAFYNCRNKIVSVSFAANSKFTTCGIFLLGKTSVQSVDLSNCRQLTFIQNGFCHLCKNLSTFIFPPNVVTCGRGILHSCSALKELTFPDSLTTINEYDDTFGTAMGYTSRLKVVHIGPNSQLTTMKKHVFYSSGITSFHFPKTLVNLGEAIFCLCPIKQFTVDPLNPAYSTDGVTIYNKNGNEIISVSTYKYGTNYRVRENVTCIRYQAFRNVPSPSIEFTNQNVQISNGAFYNTDIKNIPFPTGLTSVPSGCFSFSTTVNMTLGKNIKIIYNSAFSECQKLMYINIPEGVTSINDNAFYNCISLREIIIPWSVTSFGVAVFASCDESLNVIFLNSTRFQIKDYLVFCDSKLIDYFGTDINADIIIPNNCLSVASHLFEGKKLRSVTFETISKVTNFYVEAFSQSTLKTIVFPPSLESISEKCFENCKELVSVTMDGSLTHITKDTFKGCIKLTTLLFKTNVITTIEENAFANTQSLQSIDLLSLTSLHTIGKDAFSYSGLLTINLPASILTLNVGSFMHTPTTSINIQKASLLSQIPINCFTQCTKLTNVDLSDSVANIDSNSFNGCTSLKSFRLSPATKFLQTYAFLNSKSLENIIIPAQSQLTRIYGFAFKGTNLSRFIIEDHEKFTFEFGTLMNKNRTNLIYFIPSANVKSYVVPGTITNIGDYAFISATNLIEVIIPTGVLKKIGYHAFDGCSSLKRIIIPSSVEIIDQYAFLGCEKFVCGGVFIPDELVTAASDAGIPSSALSLGCRNNFDALMRRNSCRVKPNRSRSSSHIILFLSVAYSNH